MQMLTDCNLTDRFLLTLKSQEQKTFKAMLLVDLNVRELLPNDLDILKG